MNSLIKLSTVLLFSSLLGCASTGQTGTNEEDRSNIVRASNLSNHIKTIPRLDFTGKGEVVNIASTSFSNSGKPLFILDGIKVGTSYGRLISLLDPNQNIMVEFLSTRRATIRYGEAGNNGAILVNRQ